MAGISTIVTAVVGALGAVGTIQQRQDSRRAERRQAEAQRTATEQAEAENRRQDREFNRQNPRRPNVGELAARNAAAGASPTMLTGPQGAPVDDRLLGRTTLLGS